MGMEAKEVSVTNSPLTITLSEQGQNLKEVVIITDLAIMKINHEQGFESVTYGKLTNDGYFRKIVKLVLIAPF